MMKKFLHSTLLLGAALLCGFSFASCNSDKEPEDPTVVTQLDYMPIQAPELFKSPVDTRDLNQSEIRDITTAQNRGAVVLRSLKDVENYFGSKLEENSPLRSVNYSEKSVVTATLLLRAPIVKTTLGWSMETTKNNQYYVFSCLMQYDQGTEDQYGNIYYIIQPAIVVDAVSTGSYVFLNPNANTTTSSSGSQQ